MARKEYKNKAIQLRKQGMSYSDIGVSLGVSKSTLSGWLSYMPLSKKRILELQHSDVVVEKKEKPNKKIVMLGSITCLKKLVRI